MKGHEQETCSLREVVLASNEASRDAHKALYHYAENMYMIVRGDLLDSIVSASGELNRLHICSPWSDIVRIAAWKSEPNKGEIFLLLRNAGIEVEELRPFRDSDAGDIFPWLYYGRRVDVLRKICRNAKTNVERHTRNGETRVYCHLISEDTKSIVASSL